MYQAAAISLDAIAGPVSKVSGRNASAMAGLDTAQLAVNQNGLLKIGGDQVADGIRTHLGHLLATERKVKLRSPGDGDGELGVKMLGDGAEPEGTKIIGETRSGGDESLQNLKDAFEYATNAALVSLVLTGVTSGITTLTTRGG